MLKRHVLGGAVPQREKSANVSGRARLSTGLAVKVEEQGDLLREFVVKHGGTPFGYRFEILAITPALLLVYTNVNVEGYGSEYRESEIGQKEQA